MDAFQGSRDVKLQPGDTNVPYNFKFTVASSSNRNDGALPYGSTVISVTCDSHKNDGTMVSTGNLVHSNTDFQYSSNVVMIPLTYSTQLSSGDLGHGLYHLSINVLASRLGNTSDAFTKQFDFNRVEVGDI